MPPSLLLTIGTLASATAVYAGLRFRQQRLYAALARAQASLGERHGRLLEFRAWPTLPPFDDKLVALADFLPQSTFNALRRHALTIAEAERSYVPGHKKGGTVAYADLQRRAPELVAFYQAPELIQLCSRIVGERLLPTPIHDQSSCSLLIYDRPADHIGWHYDHNFYDGRHFTVLYALINENRASGALSSAQLTIRCAGADRIVPTPPNTLVMFEGARVLHKVTRLQDNELRVMLSMTYCADPRASALKRCARRLKDTAYFGVRALWT